MVERKLANETPYWVSECNLNIRENNSARVDYVAFTPAWGKGPEVSAAELGRFDFYEVKSCMEDFKSGHGLNFEGDTNILVCERELADELCRRRMFPKNCDNGAELCCSECDCRHSYDDEPEFCMGCGARVVE